jgi:hypothetical protein
MSGSSRTIWRGAPQALDMIVHNTPKNLLPDSTFWRDDAGV